MARSIPEVPDPAAEYRRAQAWNAQHGVGAEVEVRLDDGALQVTKTRSPAFMLDCGIAVVHLNGLPAGYRLDRVRAL